MLKSTGINSNITDTHHQATEQVVWGGFQKKGGEASAWTVLCIHIVQQDE